MSEMHAAYACTRSGSPFNVIHSARNTSSHLDLRLPGITDKAARHDNHRVSRLSVADLGGGAPGAGAPPFCFFTALFSSLLTTFVALQLLAWPPQLGKLPQYRAMSETEGAGTETTIYIRVYILYVNSMYYVA